MHVSWLYIMDEFAAASRTGRAGLISKRLERCYLYRELEGLQEQQEEEEEDEEQGGGRGGSSSARQHHRHLTDTGAPPRCTFTLKG